MDQSLTLSELNMLVKNTLQEGLPNKYTVVAEISEFNESRGHAYVELIEKNEDDAVLAKSRATIWASVYRMLKPYFESTTGHFLRAGLKVLVVVTVEFHEVYGLSLNIKDIDPTYTVGDIEKKRQAILQRLEEEGVFDMNKEIDFPLVPQRIAVISSESAAGYGDFIDQLNSNIYDFKFHTKLFQAGMQGEDTERTVIAALETIYEEIDEFDVVVIIRGGGSKSDLAWFDSYQIAVNIAQFPLPILTGIGHERDETVSDTVAYTNLKTPTAVADFLIYSVNEFWEHLNERAAEIIQIVMQKIENEKLRIERIKQNLYPFFTGNIQKQHSYLDILKEKFRRVTFENINRHRYFLENVPASLLNKSSKAIEKMRRRIEISELGMQHELNDYFLTNRHKLEVLEQKNNYLNPDKIFKRGYSITIKDGKIIRSAKDVKPDDIIKTQLIDGTIQSKVEK
jgi:exodeoxyribonuclease VII large subunit